MASIELVTKKRFMLVTGRGSEVLAKEVSDELKLPLTDMTLETFANGEIYVRYGDSVRGADVFIIQSHCTPINDRIMEQLIMIDAAKRASAKRITAVIPFYAYARQDRKASGREPITAKLIADMLMAAGVDRVVTVDLHTGQIQGFFNGPVDHLTAVPMLAEYLGSKIEGNITVVSPDAGGGKRARKFATLLEGMGFDTELAFIDKRRPKDTMNQAVAEEVVGDVDGRVCVIVDDMIDTAGTMCAAVDLLISRGATEVYMAATHGVLSGPAIERLEKANVKEVVITNTIPLSEDKQIDKIKVLSIAPVIAEALDHVFEDASISEMFQGDNF
ncbi:MAG: ribose-phosphate diphosphokinase [Acidimicrobiia bacterium]